VFCMALMNVVPTTVTTFGLAFATSASYGIRFSTTTYLWISVVGNTIAVILIPFVGNLSDKIGRRPLIIVGSLGAGILAFPYLWAIQQRNVVLAFVLAMLMWGVIYQGYNAVFPAYYQELFPTRTRVTGFAVSQNLGTMVTAFLPTIYAIVARPGSNVPLIVGGIAFGITVISAIAAYTAQETYRIHMNDLGDPNAEPVPKEEYDRQRAAAMAS
jgi:MFS family permease